MPNALEHACAVVGCDSHLLPFAHTTAASISSMVGDAPGSNMPLSRAAHASALRLYSKIVLCVHCQECLYPVHCWFNSMPVALKLHWQQCCNAVPLIHLASSPHVSLPAFEQHKPTMELTDGTNTQTSTSVVCSCCCCSAAGGRSPAQALPSLRTCTGSKLLLLTLTAAASAAAAQLLHLPQQQLKQPLRSICECWQQQLLQQPQAPWACCVSSSCSSW
jgi:hypothetical protein